MPRRKSLFFGLLVGFLAGYGLFVTFAWLAKADFPVAVARAAEERNDDFAASAETVQEVFREVSARVLPSVVEITVKSDNVIPYEEEGELPWDDFFSDPSEDSEGPRFFRSHGLGSGVIIEKQEDIHYVLTNAHVVGKLGEITLELFDGRKVSADLVGTDERKDLAVVRFEMEDSLLSAVPMGDSDSLYIGDWVLAYGSPYGYEQSASYGIVSALGRRDGPGENINDFIQTDAAINQGNSGGALVNIHGELVGINTFITTPNSGSIGLGFAIPVNNTLTTVKQLIETGEVKYGWLGVSLGEFGAEAGESLGFGDLSGSMVYQVFRDSPGAVGGLRAGDLITALNGQDFPDSSDLIYRIGDKGPGSIVTFSVYRFGELLEIDVEMGERGLEEDVREMHGDALPGFVAAPLMPDIREAMALPDNIEGVPVAEVYPRTTAQSADLRAGDIITAIGGRPVGNLQEMYEALSLMDSESPEYTVYRDGSLVNLESTDNAPEGVHE